MTPTDPFEVLGLERDATVEQVRAARRALAKEHHPDQGGDEPTMQRINQAALVALQRIEREQPGEGDRRTDPVGNPEPQSRSFGGGVSSDMPSFAVEALPAETFEALVVVASWFGEVLDEDPPYRLDTYLFEPFDCWCGLEVVPDAGGSTVSLVIAGIDGSPTPDVLDVRDAWITNLNAIDWP